MFGKSAPDNDTPGPSRRVKALAHQLDEARDVHRLATDPMLGAVTADRFRVSVTRTMWFFLAVGLGFTTTGVHDFLAGHLPTSDPMWWGAWLAEPALAGILITLLRWEAAMLSHGIDVADKPVRYLKREVPPGERTPGFILRVAHDTRCGFRRGCDSPLSSAAGRGCSSADTGKHHVGPRRGWARTSCRSRL
jgi:hypothetical protein